MKTLITQLTAALEALTAAAFGPAPAMVPARIRRRVRR